MKVLENRLRRTAVRRGYFLEKSRVRDRKGITFARYRLLDTSGRDWEDHRKTIPFVLTLAEVEQFLESIGEGEEEDDDY
jgi:hypothetical protein